MTRMNQISVQRNKNKILDCLQSGSGNTVGGTPIQKLRHGKLLIPQQVLHSTKKPFHIAIRCGGKVAAEHIEAGIPYIRLINGIFIVCPRVITCHFKSSAGGDTIPLGHGIESKLQFDQS